MLRPLDTSLLRSLDMSCGVGCLGAGVLPVLVIGLGLVFDVHNRQSSRQDSRMSFLFYSQLCSFEELNRTYLLTSESRTKLNACLRPLRWSKAFFHLPSTLTNELSYTKPVNTCKWRQGREAMYGWIACFFNSNGMAVFHLGNILRS